MKNEQTKKLFDDLRYLKITITVSMFCKIDFFLAGVVRREEAQDVYNDSFEVLDTRIQGERKTTGRVQSNELFFDYIDKKQIDAILLYDWHIDVGII